jgi:hypothetical protein
MNIDKPPKPRKPKVEAEKAKQKDPFHEAMEKVGPRALERAGKLPAFASASEKERRDLAHFALSSAWELAGPGATADSITDAMLDTALEQEVRLGTYNHYKNVET